VKKIADRYEGRAIFEELPNRSHWPIGEPGWEQMAEQAIDWLDGILDDTSESLSV
jgi:hypothetical protein